MKFILFYRLNTNTFDSDEEPKVGSLVIITIYPLDFILLSFLVLFAQLLRLWHLEGIFSLVLTNVSRICQLYCNCLIVYGLCSPENNYLQWNNPIWHRPEEVLSLDKPWSWWWNSFLTFERLRINGVSAKDVSIPAFSGAWPVFFIFKPPNWNLATPGNQYHLKTFHTFICLHAKTYNYLRHTLAARFT